MWVFNATPRPLYPGKQSRHPLYRRLDGPHGRSERVRKISPPPGFDPRTVQPVASRYTDWATPADSCFIKPYKTFYCVSACNTYHTAHTTVSLRMNPKRFETCRRRKTLNINLENCAFCWYVLYHYITLHGANNVKFTGYLLFLNRRTGYLTHNTIIIYKYNNYNNKNWWSLIQHVSTCINHLLVFL
jgi:hypothetical protein